MTIFATDTKTTFIDIDKKNGTLFELILSSKEIEYKELKMIKEVIELLESHRKTAISRLKKWTVKEYDEDRKLKQDQSEKMLEA